MKKMTEKYIHGITGKLLELTDRRTFHRMSGGFTEAVKIHFKLVSKSMSKYKGKHCAVEDDWMDLDDAWRLNHIDNA